MQKKVIKVLTNQREQVKYERIFKFDFENTHVVNPVGKQNDSTYQRQGLSGFPPPATKCYLADGKGEGCTRHKKIVSHELVSRNCLSILSYLIHLIHTELLGPLDRRDMLNEGFASSALMPEGENKFPGLLPSIGSTHMQTLQQKIPNGPSSR